MVALELICSVEDFYWRERWSELFDGFNRTLPL